MKYSKRRYFTQSDKTMMWDRWQKVRGVGPMTSTAMVATVGDARQYSKRRQMVAALANKTAGMAWAMAP